MSNGNETWMPLYIGDYLGDTMELDGAQHGAYLLLLMYYWRNGPLPTDEAKLAQIARTDIRVWKKTVGPVVRAFFREMDGRLHQKRADKELAKAGSISAKRRAAAEARWTNGKPHPHPNIQDANAMQMHPVCMPDADANGMLRAPALPSPSQKKVSKREPPYPHEVGEGTPASPGTPPRRAEGTNLRAEGTNPRKNGTNPRNAEIPWRSGALEVIYNEGLATKDAEELAKFNDFVAEKGLRYGNT